MYTKEVGDAICERLAEGESLRSICRDEAMPGASTLFRWLDENAEFREQYTRARATGDDLEFEGLQDMADEEPQRGPTGAVDPGWVAWHRNRIDVRKWTLARKRPKKYGDKITAEHTGPDGAPLFEKMVVEVVKPGG